VDIYETTTTPLAAAAWLGQHPQSCSALWADYSFGGYLSFALPTCHPWMDSRFNAFPPEQWTDYVLASRAENWQELFDRYGIQNLLLSKAAQGQLIEAVQTSRAWCEEYQDDRAIIFTRCGSGS